MPSVRPSSSIRSIRWPRRETNERRLIAPELAVDQRRAGGGRRVDPVVEAAQDVRAADVALLEQHQHLVPDLGQEHGAAVLPGARLHGPCPVADIGVGQPREGQLHPRLLLRVVGIADLGDHRALPGTRTTAATAGCQSVQAPLLPPGHRERCGVTGVRVVAMVRGGDGVLAVERRADIVDGDGGSRMQFRISPGHALELGEGTGDLLGDRGRRTVDLGLGAVGDVTGHVHRIAELLGDVHRVDGRQHGAGRRRRRGCHEGLLLRQIPTPGLHLLDLLGRGDQRPEAQQVGAEPQHQWILRGGLPALRCGVGLLGFAEVEFAVLDGDLVADLVGQ